jgi:radical SAM superfamily enzyme YgiQ (UPF0313 family)
LYKIYEANAVKKDLRKVQLKFALCYPEPYRVGMSCLAIHTLYEILNSRKNVACERSFFQPHISATTSTLESNIPLSKMDVIGFSLQYETDYVNVLRMLLDSGIPLRSDQRNEKDPLVIAGGPCATGNPEPMSDFVDIFVVGDAESVLPKIIDLAIETKKPRAHLSEFLDVKGLYIPSTEQDSIEREWIQDLNTAAHPVRQIVPINGENTRLSPIFGKTLLTEVTRGCGHGCRFCYAGYIGRPYRERTINKVEDIIEQGTKATGVSKVSLIGSGLSDYHGLTEICDWIVNESKLGLSVASLRASTVSVELLKLLAKGGERTLTVAPEAGSESLRDSLNKKITDDDVIQSAENALEAGLRNLKMYFMIGLPGERSEDVKDIINMVKRIGKLGYKSRSIRLSIAPFIPKPHTPFQWFGMSRRSDLEEKLRILRSNLCRSAKIDVESPDLRWSRIQTVLSMAGKDIGRSLEYVARAGGTLGAWRRAIGTTQNISSMCESNRSPESKLPWDKIKIGVRKEFLKDEMHKALSIETSPSCSNGCHECGVC